MWHSDYIVQKFFILGLLLFLICLIMSLGLIFMLFRRMFVKQYNILQKFILLVALGYFIWWLNGGIDDLKYQVYKEKREEVVKMILEGEIKKEVSSKLIDLPEKYKIISSGGDILYLESPLSDSVFGFWETRGIVSSGSICAFLTLRLLPDFCLLYSMEIPVYPLSFGNFHKKLSVYAGSFFM